MNMFLHIKQRNTPSDFKLAFLYLKHFLRIHTLEQWYCWLSRGKARDGFVSPLKRGMVHTYTYFFTVRDLTKTVVNISNFNLHHPHLRFGK